MSIRLRYFIWATVFLSMAGAFAQQGNDADKDKPLLRAAIFVQNRAGQEFQDKLDVLNDMISTRLTEKGFSIINKNDVVAKFRESRESDTETASAIEKLVNLATTGKADSTVEGAITEASALRISQMIDADYMIFATINSAGKDTIRFKGQGTIVGADSEVTTYTLRIALKVLEGNQGGSLYGDTVTVNEKAQKLANLEMESSDIVNRLLDKGAVKIADNISGKVEGIRTVVVKNIQQVEFFIESNVEGASVELDGAAIGSAPGRFTAAPGLHQVRVTKEFFAPWEKTANILQNQKLTVSLEFTEDGARRYKDLETFKQQMAKQTQDMELEKKVTEAELAVAKEQSAADAEATRKIAEGEKKKREQSYVHDDGFGKGLKEVIHGD